MSGLADLAAAPSAEHRRPGSTRLIAEICAAHFVSHYYMLLLPPLFALVRDEYQVSYTELGIALAAFNVVSAVLQTPAGFAIDRFGARPLLVAGLVLGGVSCLVIALFQSFWLLVAMFALCGLANTVYHPADYALLSHHVPPARIGQAFSAHTFAGLLGAAVAPATMLAMAQWLGWRGAFLGAGALGLAVALALALGRDPPRAAAAAETAAAAPRGDRHLLVNPVVLINLAFFILVAIVTAGFTNYTVVALAALHQTPLVLGNTALTVQLFASAFGVLAAGFVVGRTSRHALIAGAGTAVTAAGALILLVDLAAWQLLLAMAVTGFCTGFVMPARDLIVRAVTPPGAFGRVFGFVTTGFAIGAMVAPFIFGPMMDHGRPGLIFAATAFAALGAVGAVIAGQWVQRPASPDGSGRP